MSSSQQKALARRHYHKHRILNLLEERKELLQLLIDLRLSATTAKEHTKLEKRLKRVQIMLESSAKAYGTSGYSTANQITMEHIDAALAVATPELDEAEFQRRIEEALQQ